MKFTGNLRALWEYRNFIFASVRRDFEARYYVSLLGSLWAVLNPLAQIIVYTVILAGVMRAKLPGVEGMFGYSIYLTAGIITWMLFMEIVSRTTGIFVEHANLLKKLSFPRICLPAVVTLSAIINFLIIFALFLVFLSMSNNSPGWELLGIIPVVIVQILFALGLGITLGVANVFFRDVAQGVAIILQFWFWLTPIVYPLSIIPDEVRPWIMHNPLTPITSAYQNIFVFHLWPDWHSLFVPAVVAIGLAAFGLQFFRHHAAEIVDEL